MEHQLKKKYGLFTAIAMVVGIVIGSGVFFKAEAVLKATGGNMPLGIAAWVIVGLIMIICSYSFATMATKYERINGVVDYAEMGVGEKYGYYVGWFMATIYNPTLTSVLAWVSARYTCVLLDWDITGGACMTISCFYLVGIFAINALSPIIAGKFQVATTTIKLIPLLLMAVVGTIVGLANGMTVQNFGHVVDSSISVGGGLFSSIVAVAFAYEGWIIATSINAELNDSKKNLPKALILGSLIVVAVYIAYYIGLAGAVTTDRLMESGQAGAKLAFQNIFGSVGGTMIFVFIIISCLGTLNGLMMGCTRGMYALAARNTGPLPETFIQVDKVTNMPSNSSILGLLFCGIWLLYFYGANLTEPWFGVFCFDTSELPIVTLYAAYIPIFLMLMKKDQLLKVKT
jgi:APA family basic amino acid/polyamine antiporter